MDPTSPNADANDKHDADDTHDTHDGDVSPRRGVRYVAFDDSSPDGEALADALGDEDGDGAEPADAEWAGYGFIDRAYDWLAGLGWRRVVTFLTVGASMALIAKVLHPSLILRDTTPTGGDMGAHVWGPAYLRDYLLPKGRLAGWSPDWYAGFPAFQFYMVLPALFIVILNVGLDPLPAAAMVGAMAIAVHRGFREPVLYPYRKWILTAAVIVTLLVVGLPYGVSFKIVATLGLITMPLSAYLLGRFSGMPFPVPAVMSVSMLPFVFDRSFNILGGNIASTMAGEFAFSLSLSLSLVYLGLMYRALHTGQGRGWAAAFFALTALCHLLVAFIVIGVTLLMVLTYFGRRQLKTLVLVGGVGGLLCAFWVLPFFWKRTYVNDMGWVKKTNYINSLVTRVKLDPGLKDSPPLRVMLIIAALGLLLSLVRRNRMGVILGLSAAAVALAFRFMPEGRLWNGRILPEYYLYVYLLAGVGVGELFRAAADVSRSRFLSRSLRTGAPIAAFLAMWLIFGPSLRVLPGGWVDKNTGVYHWPRRFSLIATRDHSFLPGWAEWNFRGYEEKKNTNEKFGAYPEYYAINQTMRTVGNQYGCGRALWEFDGKQESYGTTMAMMLLPHWTNSCIPSMEGLYFEASSSTAFHFLSQSALSVSPSRAQSHVSYPNFDVTLGIQQLQMMGVRYYMAFSSDAVAAARANPDLYEVAQSGPWRVFLVNGSDLVQPLGFEPVVYSNVDGHQKQWLPQAVEFYNHPDQWDVFRAASGPPEWQRWAACPVTERQPGVPGTDDSEQQVCEPPPKTPVEYAAVTNTVYDDDEISFEVDKIGVPILVKASYFPNWKVSGAKGPYRVTPNLMVVVPTENKVRLHYGYVPIDHASNALTLGGLIALFALFRARVEPDTDPWFDPIGRWFRRKPRPDEPGEGDDDGGELAGDAELARDLDREPEHAAGTDHEHERDTDEEEVRETAGRYVIAREAVDRAER